TRAGHDGAAAPARVSTGTVWMGRVVVLAAVAAILTGTIVTGSGPHGGDEEVERLPFLIHTVARVHGVTVVCFLLLVLATGWRLRRDGATADVWRRYNTLLVVLLAQA